MWCSVGSVKRKSVGNIEKMVDWRNDRTNYWRFELKNFIKVKTLICHVMLRRQTVLNVNRKYRKDGRLSKWQNELLTPFELKTFIRVKTLLCHVMLRRQLEKSKRAEIAEIVERINYWRFKLKSCVGADRKWSREKGNRLSKWKNESPQSYSDEGFQL